MGTWYAIVSSSKKDFFSQDEEWSITIRRKKNRYINLNLHFFIHRSNLQERFGIILLSVPWSEIDGVSTTWAVDKPIGISKTMIIMQII